ncbi:5-bromo-4-chloroindolyl phosphate hydrolysis family protein [uncultured Flavonifractor sp.]|uniref:5-bromo-4-chloroindolyl phosphate hydrolysis family protein n=1 Tax=uncultured Flavonifractor sp. TaxID=1193534 RepID=UPI0026309A41|nr:5-bromo-4-chloroindolyl phosphate hydrolysis family protein [uncultured Flavonifractor sp.]
MSYYRNRRPDNGNELFSWILILILLVTLWPVGIILLVRKLVGMGRRPQFPYLGPSPGTQGVRTPPPNAAGKRPSLGKGKAMTIIGAIMAVLFGIATVSGLPVVSSIWGFPMSLAAMSPVIGLFAGGLALMAAGSISTRKAKRFRKYLALIGRRESVSVVQLAHAMPVSVRKACSDLQEMLDEGILPAGYLDMSSHELILSDEGLKDEPEPEKTEEAQEEEPLDLRDDDAVLREIRRLNDDIDDPAMSRKIDRIGEITSKIYGYAKQNPGKEDQLRSFLNYYLPTTLKILKAYARMEDQGVEGENIRTAKARIEGMMDKVVDGFEKQLDRLFEVDTMDITADVEVLERMLEKDGLSGGMDFGQKGTS